jgi:hypothetical protein
MPITKDDLLAFANDEAARFGMRPVNRRVLSDWIDEGLIEGARPKGVQRGHPPLWPYPDEAKTTVSRIEEFKSQGAERVSQLRICLWVFWRNYDFEKIKHALKLEFRRITKQMQRQSPWWNYDHRYGKKLPEPERRKYECRLPPLDPELAATGINLSRHAQLEIASRTYWGSRNGELIPQIISSELRRIFGEAPAHFPDFRIFLEIGGAFGNSDEIENSGQEILDKIIDDDLKSARDLIWFCFMCLAAGEIFFSVWGRFPKNKLAVAYRKATASFLRPDWIIPSLALFAISAFRLRTAKRS